MSQLVDHLAFGFALTICLSFSETSGTRSIVTLWFNIRIILNKIEKYIDFLDKIVLEIIAIVINILNKSLFLHNVEKNNGI